jgi:hypothetical protein
VAFAEHDVDVPGTEYVTTSAAWYWSQLIEARTVMPGEGAKAGYSRLRAAGKSWMAGLAGMTMEQRMRRYGSLRRVVSII